MTEKIFDLRSDTVTLPSAEMRKVMAEAIVGDDVYGEDPSINALEEKCAALTGKEAALFVSSGTQGNLVSILAHTHRGDEIIVGRKQHIFAWEQGSAASLAGVNTCVLENQSDGTLLLEDISSAVRMDDVHCPVSKLVCLENTQDGKVLKPEYLSEVREIAYNHKMATHLDGARLFNAAIALNQPLQAFTKYVDSVQLCFSKGLAAPVGSIVCGTKSFIHRAKRARKALGGGMRQAGILAAACNYAIDNMFMRLEEDHQNARYLASCLAEIPCIKLDQASVQTNMIFFDVNLPADLKIDFHKQLKAQGVLVSSMQNRMARAVTHYGLDRADMEEVAQIIKNITLIFAAKAID